MGATGDSDRFAKALAEWEKAHGSTAEPQYTGAGIQVKPLYTPEDIRDLDYMDKLGFPGSYPYARGVYPLMYRSRLWTMRQYAGYATARESNERNKMLVKEGMTGLSVAFDLPTQMGYDSDHPEIIDEVGRVGVAIDTLADMEVLFDGIPLDRISTSFTINAITPVILAMYVVVGEKQGVPPEKLTGTVQNDILKEYLSRGAFVFPLEPSMRLIGDVCEYCSVHMPRFVPISVCGYHIREAGANAVQEVAFAFLNAVAYLKLAMERGISIDSLAPRISFNFAAYMDLFEEIAKFRAARRLWARILRYKLGARAPRSWRFLYFAGTGGSTYTAQQPENNIIRGTIETLAIVLGGCQALTVNTKDEGHTIPSAQAKLTALRTQQIIAYETGVGRVVDPLAGSYFIESLTDEMERRIEALMEEVDAQGGIVRGIEEGWIQRMVLHEAYKLSRAIDSGEHPVIGVNMFTMEEDPPEGLQERDEGAVEEQIKSLQRVKAGRDGTRVRDALGALREAASTGKNIMEPTVEAVRAYATVGEITSVLKEAFGVFREPLDVF